MPDEFSFIPDWNASGTTKADVSNVKFGDGYSQRQTKGMNPLGVTWSVGFTVRTDAELDALSDFLKARYGVAAFTWTAPGEVQAKWICNTWTRVKAGNNVGSLTATLEMVNEP